MSDTQITSSIATYTLRDGEQVVLYQMPAVSNARALALGYQSDADTAANSWLVKVRGSGKSNPPLLAQWRKGELRDDPKSVRKLADALEEVGLSIKTVGGMSEDEVFAHGKSAARAARLAELEAGTLEVPVLNERLSGEAKLMFDVAEAFQTASLVAKGLPKPADAKEWRAMVLAYAERNRSYVEAEVRRRQEELAKIASIPD